MPISEAQTKARYKYEKEKLKRIPLDVKKEEYERIKDSAIRANESVNGYIKGAIRDRMDKESKEER